MGKKYIVELEDNELAYKTSIVGDTPMIKQLIRYAYTEPDIDAIRKDAYDKGLNDAWECARKLLFNKSSGGIGFNAKTIKETFGVSDDFEVLRDYSPAEAIEKIRQYEQEKEEQIQVGDEVENTQTGVKFIVTHLWKNNRGEQGVSGFNQECSAFSTTLSLVIKTGRHFPEIAEVLQKMKGSES